MLAVVGEKRGSSPVAMGQFLCVVLVSGNGHVGWSGGGGDFFIFFAMRLCWVEGVLL
jgi:hypothetical protein